MLEINIDGQTIEAEEGAMLIDVADKAGIRIPRFCYHQKLSVAANCRMCLVEVEKSPKPLPACATPVSPGMTVLTQSKKALDAQKAVMEFLLINHPLDCPICDQGGQCELQDVAMGYGGDTSAYTQGKRSVQDEDIGALVYTEMTRCIHCTRCVRFGQEIAGMPELGLTQRGENAKISTYVKHSLRSEVAGNIIDLCPVGALTAKPSRFDARAWEVEQRSSVSSHDCLGSNLYFQTRRNKVMSVTPKMNEGINEVWLSDRDRFAHLGIHSDQRLTKPLVKQNGHWHEVEWQVALNFAAEGLSKVKAAHGADQLAGLLSQSATVEEGYLFQRLLRSLGSNNIDHRTRRTDFSDQDHYHSHFSLGLPIADLEKLDSLLLVGSNVREEQPLAGLRVRKAAMNGAKIMCVNAIDYDFHFDLTHKCITAPQEMVYQLAGIAKALSQEHREALSDAETKLLTTVTPYAVHQEMAVALREGQQKAIILGATALSHPDASTLRVLADIIGKLSGATVGYLTPGANSSGLSFAGVLPHRNIAGSATEEVGAHAHEMFAIPRKAYVLCGIEPDLDCISATVAMSALSEADFVVAMSAYRNDALLATANVILPMTTTAETSGTFVNIEGRWQSFKGAIKPVGDSRPAWKILRVLGNLLELPRFGYTTSQDILSELKSMVDLAVPATLQDFCPERLPDHQAKTLTRITEWPIYAGDAQVRHAPALQQSRWFDPVGLRIHPETAATLKLENGQKVTVKQAGEAVSLIAMIDARVPVNCTLIAAGAAQTVALGQPFGEVTLL